jgi:hypothetical protein
MNPNDRNDRFAPSRIHSWNVADDGVDMLRLTIIVSVLSSMIFKFLGGNIAIAVTEVVVSVILATFTMLALNKWRAIPPASGATGLATIGFAGSVINLVGAGFGLVITLMAVGGAFTSTRSFKPWLLVLGLITIVGSFLQVIGFLLSARAAALHVKRPDVAAMATRTLVLGLITVGLALFAVLGSVGRGDGAVLLLVLLLALAVASLVLFLVTLSGIQKAIRFRPDLSEAFS